MKHPVFKTTGMPQLLIYFSFLEILCQQDNDDNTALHIAAKEPTDDKLKIIANMLERGAIPSKKNKNNETFLKMSLNMPIKLRDHINKMEDSWFEELIKNEELLLSFVDLGEPDDGGAGDAIFWSILKKFSSLTATKGTVGEI